MTTIHLYAYLCTFLTTQQLKSQHYQYQMMSLDFFHFLSFHRDVMDDRYPLHYNCVVQPVLLFRYINDGVSVIDLLQS